MDYAITASALNLRLTPVITPSNIVRVLSRGERVTLVENRDADWWRVRTTTAPVFEGWVSARYLGSVAEVQPPPSHSAIGPVHCPATAASRRSSTRDRHCVLGEPNMPERDVGASPGDRVRMMGQIVDFLGVEQGARYAPAGGLTFCNIYAYDCCALARAYLPRVWWTDAAIADLANGREVSVGYATTVTELNANALHGWLTRWGPRFGWAPILDLNDLQASANAGGIGIICGLRLKIAGKRRSGHITVVLPEDDRVQASRSGTQVLAPVQTQAGARNKTRFATAWWVQLEKQFEAVGFWHHE